MPYVFDQDRLSVGRTHQGSAFTTDAGITWTSVGTPALGPGAQVAAGGLIVYGVRTNVTINGVNKLVRRSIDGGATWVNIGVDPQAGRENRGLERLSTGRLIIPLNNPAGAGSPTEIVYSDDEGATWTLVNVDPAMTDGTADYGIWRVSGDVLLIHMRGTVGGITRSRLYRSIDGGVSWVVVFDPGGTNTVGSLYHDIVSNNIILKVFRPITNFLNIYLSTNNGVSFILVYAPAATQPESDINFIYKSKTIRGDRFLYSRGPTANSLARSGDNGATWITVTPAGLIYGNTGGGMFRTRNRLFMVGTDAGLGNVSTDDGDTWAPAPAGLGNANFTAAMLDPVFIGGSKAKKMGGSGVAGFSPGLAPPFIPARR